MRDLDFNTDGAALHASAALTILSDVDAALADVPATTPASAFPHYALPECPPLQLHQPDNSAVFVGIDLLCCPHDASISLSSDHAPLPELCREVE